MLYYLFDYLHESLDFPGAGVFQYISFRAGMAFIFSLLVTIFIGKKIINILQKKQLGEEIRKLGLEGQEEKAGVPTMGGIIIILGILIPVLLFSQLDNVYIILLMITTVWLGFIGGLDDYLKKKHKNKDGLAGKYKIVGQVVLGLIVGFTLYFHPNVTVKEKRYLADSELQAKVQAEQVYSEADVKNYELVETKDLKTTIPFFKNNELDYGKIFGDIGSDYGWLIFVPIVIFIIVAMSNAANLTDGIDGLATGTSAIIGLALGIFAYLSGNVVFSDYLNILYIPNSGEMVIFIAAFVGSTLGFLWYNTFPAQVFMGDTGSLMLGGVIAVFAIAIRKELLLPILAGIFVAENLSVVLQVSYFKYTKKKFGEGKRIFLMSPLHHHFQKVGIKEPKIVMRFFLVGLLLAVLSIVTLKLR
ncbi:MAG: phospho-N-acetylmuramoyl-pentapeptide-transferase [Flavobacteriales bacterium]|jgi:phospho-N-acetylmuramoyl-pentapeptide-transferase|nr:phospho-N-acetylmuramoyl-pentapeptide-transferase [Flavobacteriales bacterium]